MDQNPVPMVRSKVLWAWNRLKYSKNVFNIDIKTSFSGTNPSRKEIKFVHQD